MGEKIDGRTNALKAENVHMKPNNDSGKKVNDVNKWPQDKFKAV